MHLSDPRKAAMFFRSKGLTTISAIRAAGYDLDPASAWMVEQWLAR